MLLQRRDFFVLKKYYYAIGFLYVLLILKLFYSEVLSPSRDPKNQTKQPTMTHFSSVAKLSTSEEIKLLVVSRVHMKSATTMPNPSSVLNFILRVQEYASHILICVGADSIRDTEHYIESAENLLRTVEKDNKVLPNIQLTFLPVFPWGYFTTPLNAAVQFAQDKGFKYIVFQSIEFKIPKLDIFELINLHEERSNLLVVGPEMDGHDFLEGSSNMVRGRTVPWNTLAIWKVGFLSLTGFPLIGDGTAEAREIGGVEEVSTINLLQLVNPQLQAILVRFSQKQVNSSSDIQNSSGDGTSSSTISGGGSSSSSSSGTTGMRWDTASFKGDAARVEYHARKMKSKDERPASQMKALGIANGTVIHLTVVVE